MNFIITGGTGFVGSKLTEHLTKKGHHVYIVSRNPEKSLDTASVTAISYDIDPKTLPKINGVINLAGESLFGYWTDEKKRKILESRLSVTEKIVSLMERLNEQPDVFISGSAVGYYGTSEEYIFTEKTERSGRDFLASVVSKWEAEASKANDLGIRTVYTRFGIILGENGGSFSLMALPVKLFAGGKIGDGEQWISWVHIDDVVRMIDYALFHEQISGPLNVTAPHPTRNKVFYKSLAKTLKRPYWLPTPKFPLEIILGEMSQLITKGQYVQPQKALHHGYKFQYPTVKEAFVDIT